jgi:tetratricopeptide (TPR) repeat protein
MKLKKQIILFCLIMVIELSFSNLFSQNIQTKPTRQSSFEAFSQGNYEKAYSEFKDLLQTYSKDPLYKYYSGVCLVKLSKDPGEAVTLLQQALQAAGAVKTLPSDGLFYLGRAQQMSGKYSEAAQSYNLFTNQVGKKASKEMGVPEFIQQCIQKKGQVADSQLKPLGNLKNDKTDSSKIEVKPTIKEPIQKTTEKAASAKVNLPVNYEKILDEAIEFQFKADSVTSIVNEQKKQIEKLSGTEKLALKIKLNENEKTAASFQTSADQKYHEAQLAMNPHQDSLKLPKETTKQPLYPVVKDTSIKSDNKVVKIAGKKSDTIKLFIPEVKPLVETFAFFEVLTKSVTGQNEKISIDPEVPEGLIYRIQIAVFRNPVTPAYFKGITPIYGFKIAGTDKTNYYAGMFRRSSDATKALALVKAKGFKDAFVVGLSGGKSVSPDRAALLEKEWGKKPFVSLRKSSQETKVDTIPPAISFRVEVTRSVKPLKDDMVEGIRKMAGNRGLDIQPVDGGKIAYLIGKFITFETAAEYADLLIRNGYREAQVVAWLGKKEIPIDTARQLFENLK